MMANLPNRMERVDLDQLVGEFTEWQKHVGNTSRQCYSLQEKLEASDKILALCQEKERTVTEELHDLKALVKQLQCVLDHKCDLEDENHKLNTVIEDLKRSIEEKKQEHEMQVGELETSLQDLQSAQKAELSHVMDTLKVKAEGEKRELQRTIEEKTQEINGLKNTLVETEKEHQTELVQLRLEYDNKLLRLQKHASKTQQAVQSSTPNQDIFRKKLQHMKAESDREIAALKGTVTDLRQRLQSQSSGPPQGKKRRF